MKKNDVFTFTSNGVGETAAVLESIFQGSCKNILICYAQNKIFTYIEETYRKNEETDEWLKDYSYGKVIVDYAILPDYDEMLRAEQEKFEDDCWEALSSIGDIDF